jgi:hypothetical protein
VSQCVILPCHVMCHKGYPGGKGGDKKVLSRPSATANKETKDCSELSIFTQKQELNSSETSCDRVGG